ncbi:MAG: hypothetical protein LDLANPLL_02936 [Turneriella sp.]|nr:hypothetical protein [Turneriella sp.]
MTFPKINPAILIAVGNAPIYGMGHITRMRLLALSLRKRKIDVELLVIDEGEAIDVPLEYSLVLLDRRDTNFNPPFPKNNTRYIAIDNRGAMRNKADFAIDLLPHFAMDMPEYHRALENILLAENLTHEKPRTENAKITLYDTFESARLSSDFILPHKKISHEAFIHDLKKSTCPALYFGQAFFEALYLGLHVQLYPISDYHKKLAEDFYTRFTQTPMLLAHLDGNGLKRVTEKIQSIYKEGIKEKK